MRRTGFMGIALSLALLIAYAFCSTPAVAAQDTAPTIQPIRLCTGSESGNYFAAGKVISEMASKSVKVVVSSSEGTIDNIDRTFSLAADNPEACDAFIGQPDGPVYAKRTKPGTTATMRQVGELHREYLQVLCSKASGVDDLGDLSGTTKYPVAIGEPGSGSWLVWQNIVAEDNSYAKVPTTAEGGVLALSSVASNTATCMIVTAGLPNGTVQQANDNYASKLVLADADDKDFNDAVDLQGKPLYSYANDIVGSKTVYPKLLCGTFSCSTVETISWLAGVYVNTERLNKAQLNAFVEAVMRATPRIVSAYGG